MFGNEFEPLYVKCIEAIKWRRKNEIYSKTPDCLLRMSCNFNEIHRLMKINMDHVSDVHIIAWRHKCELFFTFPLKTIYIYINFTEYLHIHIQIKCIFWGIFWWYSVFFLSWARYKLRWLRPIWKQSDVWWSTKQLITNFFQLWTEN